MARQVLEESKIHPNVRDKVANAHADIVKEVQAAIAAHDVVVGGMAQNPHPRKARRLLSEKGIQFHYLEYGSYLGEWRRRTALKMWTGWPTFPMVFVKGTLIGGAEDLKRLLDSGDFEQLLNR